MTRSRISRAVLQASVAVAWLSPAVARADSQFGAGSGVTSFMNRRGPVQLQTSDLPIVPSAKGGCGAANLSGLLKGNGSGPCTSAVGGTTSGADYVPPMFSIGTVSRPLQSFLDEGKTVRDYNASCNGTADDSFWLSTMATLLGHVVIPQDCTARIATSTNLTVPVEIKTGGKILVDGTGVVVALNGGLQAPPSAAVFAFANGGSVTFGTNQDRYPEWFGAAPNNAAVDNTASINAAVAAGAGSVIFLGAVYYHSGTLIDTTPKVHVIGRGDQATAFYLQSGAVDQFEFGVPVPGNASAPTTLPTINNLYSSLENVLFVRTVAPTVDIGPAPYNAAAKGISITNAASVTLDKVHVYGSRIGFYRRHTADTSSNKSTAEFNFASTYTGSTMIGGDFIGDFIDSQDSPYASNGSVTNTANASTTDTDSFALCEGGAGATTASSGFRIQGNFSDQWLVRPQTAACNGAAIDGAGADVANGGAVSAGTGAPYTSDVNISNPIFDSVRDFGLRVVNVPANISVVSVDNGYVSNGYTGVSRNIDIENADGVSLTGGWTVLGWINQNASSICFYTNNARQITVGPGVALLGCTNPVYMSATSGSDIRPRIQNSDTRAAANPAVVLNGGGYNTIAPMIDAINANGPVSGAFASAVLLAGGTGTKINSIDLTKALPYAFVGGLTSIACLDSGTTVTATYTSSSTGAPFFGQRLCAGSNLVTGSQP